MPFETHENTLGLALLIAPVLTKGLLEVSRIDSTASNVIILAADIPHHIVEFPRLCEHLILSYILCCVLDWWSPAGIQVRFAYKVTIGTNSHISQLLVLLVILLLIVVIIIFLSIIIG